MSTLNGYRVVTARTRHAKWGNWSADVRLEGAHDLSGEVVLVVGDLTLQGFVLSGGSTQGDSFYRLVGGKGGWGNTIPEKSYVDDAGVRARIVLEDAAREAGEVFDSASVGDLRLGPSWTRPAGQASTTLNLIAPRGWYVGEDGVTRLGTRSGSEISPKIPRTQTLNRARGEVVLASESIATLLPGITVDGMEAMDVQHDLSMKGGLRSTVWGEAGFGTSEGIKAFSDLLYIVDPGRKFRGVVEYRVVTLSGERLDLQPVRASLGMPDLDLAVVRPGVPGCKAETALGSYVLVGFVNSDPARPYVAAFEDPDGDGFQPTSLSLLAGDSAGGEHLMTVEACVVLLHNTIVGLAAMATPPAWLGSGVINGILNAAIAASNTPPAPPTAIAQIAQVPTQVNNMLTGPGTTSSAYAAAIATALSTKIANDSGLFPSVGCPAVKAG